MVAAVEPITQPTLKPRKNANSHSKRGFWQITPAIESQARTMYLVRDMPPAAIAEELKIKVAAVYFLVNKRGWSKLRRQSWGNADAEIQAKLSSDVSRVMSEIALESDELTVGSLQLPRESIAAKDAKGLSMSSTAVRNLVEVSRRIRGLDAQNGGSSTSNVNFFVLGPPAAHVEASQSRVEKNITPVDAVVAPQIAAPSVILTHAEVAQVVTEKVTPSQ